MPQVEGNPAKSVEVPAAPPFRPTPPQALLALVVVLLAIAGYVALATSLGIREFYVGFLFVFYWMTFDQGKPQRVPPIILGMCFGLVAAWLLQYSPHAAQPYLVLALFLAAVGGSIVGLILGWLPYVFNNPAMLVLTVFTIPYIQQGASFPRLFIALGFATVRGILRRRDWLKLEPRLYAEAHTCCCCTKPCKKTVSLIQNSQPTWWFIENPMGMLRKLAWFDQANGWARREDGASRTNSRSRSC